MWAENSDLKNNVLYITVTEGKLPWATIEAKYKQPIYIIEVTVIWPTRYTAYHCNINLR